MQVPIRLIQAEFVLVFGYPFHSSTSLRQNILHCFQTSLAKIVATDGIPKASMFGAVACQVVSTRKAVEILLGLVLDDVLVSEL